MFNNIKHIKSISSPILIIEASNDEVIPHKNTANLYSACQSHALLETVENTNHQTITANNAYYSCINAFINDASTKNWVKETSTYLRFS